MKDYDLKNPKIIAAITAEVDELLAEDGTRLKELPLYRSSISIAEDATRGPRGAKLVLRSDDIGKYTIGFYDSQGEFSPFVEKEYASLSGAKSALTKIVRGKTWLGIPLEEFLNSNEDGKITYEKDTWKAHRDDLMYG